MSETVVATASVRVGVDPATAFRVFTEHIDTWWKQGTRYWNDKDRGIRYHFEPGVGGRLMEVFDDASGEGFEAGRIRVWEPGQRLVFTWMQINWTQGETVVDVRFDDDGDGTLVSVSHTGWESLGEDAGASTEGYSRGWVELLGYFVEETAQ